MTGERDASGDDLRAIAMDVRRRAHCPYSGFAVGAAVCTTAGAVYAGCNVENVSLGLSVCAERNAIAAAVCAGMQPGQLQAVVVVADTQEAVRPCGACRQVIAEFAAPDCTVTCLNLRGDSSIYRWDELMPLSFGREE